MKLCLPAVAIGLFFVSCADHKAEEKKLMDDIMTTHEKVMGVEDKLMENKMFLDSVLKENKFGAKDSTVKTAMGIEAKKLTDADEAMDKWMHDFDPNAKSRQGDAKYIYLQEQTKEIHRIDTMITEAVKTSTQVLATIKK